MRENSYTQILEQQVKEYRALLDMLKEKHPKVFREWVASQQSFAPDGLYWCWKCEAWQKFDRENKCRVCKTARR